MENKFQTSFIPKRPVISGASEAGIKVRHPVNLISLVATGIFLVAVLATGGLFAYQRVITGRISSMEAELIAARKSFETELLNEFVRVDTRMKTAEQILSKHSAMSLFFGLLEEETVRTVQFRDFMFQTDENGNINVTLKGVASSYNSLALQSSRFVDRPGVRHAVFSDMDLDEKGNVMFTFKASLDPELISHKNTLTSASSYDIQ